MIQGDEMMNRQQVMTGSTVLFSLFLLTGLLLSSGVVAETITIGTPLTVSTENDTMDDSIVRAVGYGLAPVEQGLSNAEKNLLGMRAARNDALRNLAEKIDLVLVSARSSVQEEAIISDLVRTRVRALINNAKVVSESKLADGKFQVEVETDLSGLTDPSGLGK